MINISNKLVDYKMIWFQTDNKSGNLSKIILRECGKEAEKMKEEVKKKVDSDVIVVYDYKSSGGGVRILLYAFEK